MVVFPHYVKTFVSQIFTEKKNFCPSFSRQKIDFWRKFLGEWPKKISEDKIAFAAQQLHSKS